MKKKVLILMLVFGFLVFATNVFALNPGDPFTFSNTVYPSATNTWTHTLSNADFDPDLTGNEPYLIINSGNLALNLTFTPAWYLVYQQYGFSLAVMTPALDGYYIGNTYVYLSSNPGQVTTTWSTAITAQGALDAIADKFATILLTANVGTLNSVNSSILSGSGVVGPEPISMVLVGAGMVGLPFARRLRRLIKQGGKV